MDRVLALARRVVHCPAWLSHGLWRLLSLHACLACHLAAPAPTSFRPGLRLQPLCPVYELPHFQEARGVTNAEQQQQMLAEGSEAADFIRTSIVQAAMNDRGAFGAHWQPCCSCGCSAVAVGWRCRSCGTCACATCWCKFGDRQLLAWRRSLCCCERACSARRPACITSLCRP